jgi:hypothetical protein
MPGSAITAASDSQRQDRIGKRACENNAIVTRRVAKTAEPERKPYP